MSTRLLVAIDFDGNNRIPTRIFKLLNQALPRRPIFDQDRVRLPLSREPRNSALQLGEFNLSTPEPKQKISCRSDSPGSTHAEVIFGTTFETSVP